MSRCGTCGNEETVIRIDNGDGTFTYPPVVDNIITLPPDIETPFEAVGGLGIIVTPGGDDGHQPTISICAGDGITFDDDGCVTTDTPDWTSPNTTQPVNGITVTPGGTQGHDPTIGISLSPDSVGATITEDGQLLIECCEDTPWQGIAGDGIAIAPGDNPNGDLGNGHRPEIAVLVDGTTITINSEGELVALGGGGTTDVCAVLGALPAAPVGTIIDSTIAIGADGNCYRTPQCIVTADANGQEWDDTNPNWIDPATIDKWCELRLDNGITGCELWRRLEDTQGAPQWRQAK